LEWIVGIQKIGLKFFFFFFFWGGGSDLVWKQLLVSFHFKVDKVLEEGETRAIGEETVQNYAENIGAKVRPFDQ